MADHDHYMKFYVADYLADTGHLSTDEHGAYLLLIFQSFKRGGRLPTDADRLRRLAGGVKASRWTAIWETIRGFFEVDGEELIQPRAKAEWERARDAVEKAKKAGKASGDARREKAERTIAERMPNDCSNKRSTSDGESVELGPGLGSNDPDPKLDPKLDPSIRSPSPYPSSRGSDLGPAGARSNPSAEPGPARDQCELKPGPVTGHELQRLFGEIRSRDYGGFGWQGVRDATGKASTMAEMLNADPSLRPDVAPTMALLFTRAKAGESGSRSADILREPSFAFAAWCSNWTSLREEVRGVAPAVPGAARQTRAGPGSRADGNIDALAAWGKRKESAG